MTLIDFFTSKFHSHIKDVLTLNSVLRVRGICLFVFNILKLYPHTTRFKLDLSRKRQLS